VGKAWACFGVKLRLPLSLTAIRLGRRGVAGARGAPLSAGVSGCVWCCRGGSWAGGGSFPRVARAVRGSVCAVGAGGVFQRHLAVCCMVCWWGFVPDFPSPIFAWPVGTRM